MCSVSAIKDSRLMLAFNVTQHDALWVLIILAILCALVWLWKHK